MQSIERKEVNIKKNYTNKMISHSIFKYIYSFIKYPKYIYDKDILSFLFRMCQFILTLKYKHCQYIIGIKGGILLLCL